MFVTYAAFQRAPCVSYGQVPSMTFSDNDCFTNRFTIKSYIREVQKTLTNSDKRPTWLGMRLVHAMRPTSRVSLLSPKVSLQVRYCEIF